MNAVSVVDDGTAAAIREALQAASAVNLVAYRTAIWRWRHDRRHLEPILPVLRPCIEKFGHSLEADGPERTRR